MKYMGSKRAMLKNGLGDLLSKEIPLARRFVDLFTGSGAVAVHVAQSFDVPTWAFDLQAYSTVLAGAIIHRTKPLQFNPIFSSWQKKADDFVSDIAPPKIEKVTIAAVASCRTWCNAQANLMITQAYGGHYFCPNQAVWIDAFLATLPEHEPARTVALAALIDAASQCAAAPGHTAQPFQPTRTAKRHLQDAWNRDIAQKVASTFRVIAAQHAKTMGRAEVADANDAAKQLQEGDLVFIDPPYSGVHYSRFYHVLETIARGHCGEVSGVGRYPIQELRPRSKYSVSRESSTALDNLLQTVSTQGAKAILTFPDHECSNGLSGEKVREIAKKHFRVRGKSVESRFSTMGGAGGDRPKEAGRSARQHAKELVLVLSPK